MLRARTKKKLQKRNAKMTIRKGVLPWFTINRTQRLLNAGGLKAEDLVLYCHSLATAGEDVLNLNAFADIESRESLLEQARASEARRRENPSTAASRPLEGVPVSLKSNIAVSNFRLTAGSRILGEEVNNDSDRFVPGPCGYDAEVVERLRDEGAIIIGRTKMDEFGMGSLGTNVVGDFATRNPVNLFDFSANLSDEELIQYIRRPHEQVLEDHESIETEEAEFLSAGGSSCGSAASVLHGSSLLSLGSDTGGSVRLPAAWCGIVGLKPTYGVLSRHGLVSYASSLDTIGILTRSLNCASSALISLTKSDPKYQLRDSTQIDVPSFAKRDSQSVKGVRVGIPAAFSVEECPPVVQEGWNTAIEWLNKNGALIEEVSTDQLSSDLIQLSLASYYIIACAEASSNLSRYDGLRYGISAGNLDDILLEAATKESDEDEEGRSLLERQYSSTRTEGFGMEVIRRILCGTMVLSSDRFHSYYEAAAKVRGALSKELNACVQSDSGVDVLLTPTVLSQPPAINATSNTDDSIDPVMMIGNDVMTVPASLAGLPSVSVPVNVNDTGSTSNQHIPVGIQVIGKKLGENVMLDVATEIERLSMTEGEA